MDDKNTFTQETLARVISKLMERKRIPGLFMETLIETVKLYPRLTNFTMDILRRLILKNVWRNEKIWIKFIDCIKSTIPVSFQILLQLPTEQLRAAFTVKPELRESLKEYLNGLDEMQRSMIPMDRMKVIYSIEEPKSTEIKMEPAEVSTSEPEVGKENSKGNEEEKMDAENVS